MNLLRNSNFASNFVSSQNKSSRDSTSKSSDTDQKQLNKLKSQEQPSKSSVDFEDDEAKSTVSEISSEIIAENKIEKRHVSTASNSSVKKMASDSTHSIDSHQNAQENSSDSSSSTDTQILLLNRTPRQPQSLKLAEFSEQVSIADKTNPDDDELSGHSESGLDETKTSIDGKVRREDEKQNSRVADSIEESLLTDTISQMIRIREKKMQKLMERTITDEELDAEVEEIENYEDNDQQESNERDTLRVSNDLKVYIPSINLSDDDSDCVNSKSVKLKEKLACLKIPYRKERIDKLTDLAVEKYFWKRLERGEPMLVVAGDEECDELVEFFASVEGEEEVALNFKRMLFDLMGELLHDLYLERYEEAKSVSNHFPGIKKSLKRVHFKSVLRGPGEMLETQMLIKKRMNEVLKLAVSNESFLDKKPEISAKSKWRSGKKLDLVDNLLDGEMREQEHDWSNYEVEEYEAKILISNTIFDLILKDTLDCVQSVLLKKLKVN